MRPLTLRFAGLRCYRDEVEIDFTARRTIAIIGRTGAGKSTFPDGICFALYGTSIRDGGLGARSLIADGGNDTLRVEFTFREAGHTWKVTRIASKVAGRAIEARLTC